MPGERILGRRQERIEQLHDLQDSLLSPKDLETCNTLKKLYNEKVLKHFDVEPFTIELPLGIQEGAQLCFLYATRRMGERPTLSSDGHTVFFK
jgi:hypothetical protein